MAEPHVERNSREAIIASLRKELLKRAGDDRSICRLAADEGIFCQGFRRFSEADLKLRLRWIARKRPSAGRAEMEDLAERWQLARQEHDRLPTSCDVQCRDHDLCNGWDDFSTQELEDFLQELGSAAS